MHAVALLRCLVCWSDSHSHFETALLSAVCWQVDVAIDACGKVHHLRGAPVSCLACIGLIDRCRPAKACLVRYPVLCARCIACFARSASPTSALIHPFAFVLLPCRGDSGVVHQGRKRARRGRTEGAVMLLVVIRARRGNPFLVCVPIGVPPLLCTCTALCRCFPSAPFTPGNIQASCT